MSPRHQPVLLDLDGTVVDSAEAIFASVRAGCAAVGVHVEEGADLSFCLGPPLNASLTRIGVAEDAMQEAMRVFEAYHWGDAAHLLRPMPGAVEALDAFATRGIDCAIVTVKPTRAAERVLDLLGLRSRFALVHGRTDDFDARTKTDLLAEALDLLPGPRPLFVGDQPSDEAAAQALAIPYLAHPAASWEVIRATVLEGDVSRVSARLES